MIKNIKITDLDDAEKYAFNSNNEYDIWISTVDDEDRRKINRMKRLLSKKGIKHFNQFFCDWSDEDEDIFIVNNLETRGPMKHHIQNIITFLKPFVDDEKTHNLGVNCFAGVSRSTAIGIIASVMSGKTPKEALEYIVSVRPCAWPNLRILKFASEILNIDIFNIVKAWVKQNKNKILV